MDVEQCKSVEKELVVMAPIQIKPQLSIGNIYDLSLADFYSKARRFAGVETIFPLLENVNVDPFVSQVRKEHPFASAGLIRDTAETWASRLSAQARSLSINTDFMLRDDQISVQLSKLIAASYRERFIIGPVLIVECLGCVKIYGSDPSIINCKRCGKLNTVHVRKSLYTQVRNQEILSSLERAVFYPQGARKELIQFVDTLPNLFNLVIEKQREYTLSYSGFKLDPRFTAIILPAILGAKSYTRRTWFHGDVIKKFDYYSYCYLGQIDQPTHIVAHGVLLDESHKKFRWQSDNGSSLQWLTRFLNNGVLRAYLTKGDLAKDRPLSEDILDAASPELTKLSVKIGRTLERRNLSVDKLV